MSLVAFIAVCGIGAVIGLAARDAREIGRLASVASLFVALVAALLVGPTTRATVGDVTLIGSQYSGLFLACAAGSGLLLCVVALAWDWPDDLAPAALASFAGLAVALTATDAGVALGAGAAAATAGALVIVRTTPTGSEADGRLAEMRTIGLVSAGLLVGAIAIMRPSWSGTSDSPIFVLAFLGLGLALAVRSGAVPFHVPATRLGRTAEPLAQSLLLVWIPAGLGVLVVCWSATTFGIRSDWLNLAVSAVQVVAVATLVLGGLASLVHDELDEIAAYSIVADAGFVLLALAARTDSAAEPTRLWLLAFVAAKTGLVVWVGAVSHAFATSNVGRLRGWLRRTPLLGIALVAIAVATLGWPGSAVYEARADLIRLALPGRLQFLFAGSIVLSLACYGRLLVIGALTPTENVTAGASERPRWAFDPLRPRKTAAVADPIADPNAETALASGAAGADMAVTPVEATETKSAPAKKKSSGSRAAALQAAPTTTAAVNDAAAADTATGKGVASLVAVPTLAPLLGPPAPEQAAPTVEPAVTGREAALHFWRNLALTWRLNRTLEISLVVVAGAALAAALAFGGLGATNAARFGIPLGTAAHATPRPPPKPTPSPSPRATPVPTLAPPPTPPAPSPSTSASPSVVPLPSASPPPIKTSAPARNDTD